MKRSVTSKPDAVRRRRRAERRGRRAEWIAVWLLRLKGYRILARRLKTPVGEIDILARRGGVLAVVEVKRRPGLEAAIFALDPRQCARIARTLEWWLMRNPACGRLGIRFDLIAVIGRGRPVHLPDFWRPP